MTTTPCLAMPSDNRSEQQARDDIAKKLDLSRPSYRGAYAFAREAAWNSMRADKRDKFNAADKAAGDAVMCRLLWLVDAAGGGFIGLSDAALESRCARYRLPLPVVQCAMWAPGSWPSASVIAFPGPVVDARVGAAGTLI